MLSPRRSRLRYSAGTSAAAGSVIMIDMGHCELCDMDLQFCWHRLTKRHVGSAACAGRLLISPNGMAHFPGCPHKGADADYTRWATLDMAQAWQRLGNGERLKADGGEQLNLVARIRCQDCVGHGPW